MEATTFNPAEHLKAFKAKMNKESVIEWYGSKTEAIGFFQIQLSNTKHALGDFRKRAGKTSGFLDKKVAALVEENQPLKTAVATMESQFIMLLEAQEKLITDKIEHLKTIK